MKTLTSILTFEVAGEVKLKNNKKVKARVAVVDQAVAQGQNNHNYTIFQSRISAHRRKNNNSKCKSNVLPMVNIVRTITMINMIKKRVNLTITNIWMMDLTAQITMIQIHNMKWKIMIYKTCIKENMAKGLCLKTIKIYQIYGLKSPHRLQSGAHLTNLAFYTWTA